MNHQYLLLLGPALGFVLGVLFTWFITYSKTKFVEKKAADTEKGLLEKIAGLEAIADKFKTVEQRLQSSNELADKLEKQLQEATTELKHEVEERATLEEKVKKIEILEKNIEDLKKSERESIKFQEKLSSAEATLAETRKSLAEKQEEISEFKVRIDNLSEELSESKDKNAEFSVLAEKVKSLEEVKKQLLVENEQLRAMKDQLSQLDEIKQMYGKSLEENHILRNQDLAKHFVEIKDGLEQSIKAYNKMLNLVDDPALTDNKVIEIEAKKTTAEDDSKLGISEEEILDKFENDTDDLTKIDGDEGDFDEK